MVSIQLFGSPQVFVDQISVKLVRRKSRALLYYLAAQPRPVHRDKLLNIFWIDEPRPSALQVLRTTLYGLRSVLPDIITAKDDYIGLQEGVWVDARHFENVLTKSNFDPIKWDEQIALYHGVFLEGIDLPGSQVFEDWMVIEREHYQRLTIRALTKLSSWYEEQQDYEQALSRLNRALNLDPLQEDLQRESIRLHYLAGDRPGAIRRYDELRKLLDDEMGVPPMKETRTLYDAILADRVEVLANQRTHGKQERSLQKTSAPAGTNLINEESLPFIGRKTELSLARAGLQRSQLILVEGEPGIGKTRFVEEILSELPGLSLVARAQELEQNLPYQPVITMLRGLFRGHEWEILQPIVKRELSGVWMTEISRLIPEQGDSVYPTHLIESVRPGLTDGEEPRLWEGVYQFIETLSHHQNINLFLDDIHWADTSTIGLLSYLVRQHYPQSVRVLVTSRPFSTRTALMSMVLALAREGKILRINLPRLSAEDLAVIPLGQAQEWPDGFADWLLQYSEGNPFVLIELFRSVQFDRKNSMPIDFRRLMEIQSVPESVYTLVQTRLSHLTDHARRVLDASVAAGREFEFEVVIRAAGLSESLAVDALDELVAAGLIIPLDGFRFTFDHHLTMEVAFREVGELRHRLLHRRVAEALESLHRDHLEQIVGLLAWHYREGNELIKAAKYAFMAGSQAAHLAAWGEAIALYEQALEGMQGSERLPVIVALAEALWRSGQYAQSTDSYLAALRLADVSPQNKQRIDLKLALARTLLPQARFVEAIEQARQVLESGDKRYLVRAQLIWGTALSIEGADLSQAKHHLLEALREWEESGSKELFPLGQIQFELGSLTAQQGDLNQAVNFYRDALAVVDQAGGEEMDELKVLVLNNLAFHLHLLNDQTAKAYAEAGLTLSQEKGLIGMQTYLYSTMGEIELAAGNLDTAEKYFIGGLSIAERLAVQERIAGLNANLGLVAIARKQPSVAIYRLSKALGLADLLGTQHLAAQIRLWLAPLLTPNEGRLRLNEARLIAESSGRTRLLEEVIQLEQQLGF